MPRAAGDRCRPLNLRQRRFIEEYHLSGNGTRAAMRAGYRGGNATHTATALLRRPDVQAGLAALAEAARTAAEEAGDDPELVELQRLAFANILDFTRPDHAGGLAVDWSRMGRDQAAAIRELVVEETRNRHGTRRVLRIRMADKQAALHRLITLRSAARGGGARPPSVPPQEPAGSPPDAATTPARGPDDPRPALPRKSLIFPA